MADRPARCIPAAKAGFAGSKREISAGKLTYLHDKRTLDPRGNFKPVDTLAGGRSTKSHETRGVFVRVFGGFNFS